MGPTWVLLAPGGPHVGPMNLAVSVSLLPRISIPINQPSHWSKINCFLSVCYLVYQDQQLTLIYGYVIWSLRKSIRLVAFSDKHCHRRFLITSSFNWQKLCRSIKMCLSTVLESIFRWFCITIKQADMVSCIKLGCWDIFQTALEFKSYSIS